MNKITKAFENKKIFIPFITAGYPDKERFVEIVRMFDAVGAGIVEIGIPFSDPLADGRTIQDSSKMVLDTGINIDEIFGLVREIRKTCTVPLVFMTYYNLILHKGIKEFVDESVSAGVDGLIVPDLPPEEADELLNEAEGKLAITFLVSTISKEDRIKYIADKTTGFIYFVSRLGVTGQGLSDVDIIKEKVTALKDITDKPVSVGFGISGKSDAKKIYEFSDGIIVGSAIIDFIDKNLKDKKMIDTLKEFCVEFV